MDQNGKSENVKEGPVLVYATYPGAGEAERAGRVLVATGLAACVNILPVMKSIFRWQGSVQEAAEAVMIVKTRRGLAEAVTSTIRSAHSYKNPAILVLPIAGGSEDFLRWIQFETTEAFVRPDPATSGPEDE